MLQLNVNDETSTLRSVILGIAKSSGPTPTIEECYDPKSRLHVLAGTYPKEEDMINEMTAVADVLKKYNVQVFRPKVIKDCNQIFARDVAFVIEDKLVISNMIDDRKDEIEAIQYVIDQVAPEKVITLPDAVRVEGGDVMPHGEYIFLGAYCYDDFSEWKTARTNAAAVKHLQKIFPDKKVKSFQLRKSKNPKENALHLDCCFQPVGKDKAILHKNGFLIEEEYEWLVNYFGKENIFAIDKDEMYNMNSNIFSIAPDVVISEQNFTRLNTWLEANGFTVEKVPYAEIAKQEGLLRCSTMPLIRA